VADSVKSSVVPKVENHAQNETRAESEQNEKHAKDNCQSRRQMKITDFLFDSAYQVVTWVLIALSIGGFFYFLGKSNGRGALWSAIALFIFIAIMIGIVADRFFFRGTNKKERPYVIFRATRLKPLTVGNYPVIEYQLENISKGEVSVLFKYATCQFTQDAKQSSFQSVTSDEVKFTMAPTKVIYGQMRFPKHILVEDEIKALNQEPEQGRLAFYARGEYKDIGGGPRYPLNFCMLYNPYIDGNLIFCDSAITFREPKEGD